MDMDFLCQECGQGFEIRWKLESHMKFQHGTKIFKCIKCGEEMIGKGKYDNRELTDNIPNWAYYPQLRISNPQ